MDTIQIALLALLQGVTEFLPVSSSAHLILPAQLLNWPDQGLAFDVAVHVGTLLAVILYFQQDIRRMIAAWLLSLFKQRHTPDSRLAWSVIVATVPAGLAGLIVNDMISQHLRSALVIALATLIFGGLLWWADVKGRCHRGEYSITARDAVWIGLAQALALIPGTSRSGITMTAALLLGLTRQAAARFSFLLSIPLIMAAGLLKGAELYQTGTHAQISQTLTGGVIAFFAALMCIHLFLRLLDRIGMLPFVLYRLLLGLVLLIFFV